MQNLNRVQGYYWVFTKHSVWHIAYWNIIADEFYWTVCWNKFAMYDQDFVEINEKIIVRQQEKVLTKE